MEARTAFLAAFPGGECKIAPCRGVNFFKLKLGYCLSFYPALAPSASSKPKTLRLPQLRQDAVKNLFLNGLFLFGGCPQIPRLRLNNELDPCFDAVVDFKIDKHSR